MQDLGDPGPLPGHGVDADSKSIVFWSGGRIRRADLVAAASRAEGAAEQVPTVIPFHVKDSRKTAHAVRFGVDVLTGLMQASASPQLAGGGASFPVRMLRWVSVSPDGRRVAYQALGYVYVKDLPDGTPRRLTRQTDDFEYFPSWSRDSKSIVYATWNDQTLGSIRIAGADKNPSGASRLVTEKPGHYLLDPVFSPTARASSIARARAVTCARTRGPPIPASTSPERRRKTHARHRGRRLAALRQGARPGVLREDRGRRGPDRSGEAHPRLDQSTAQIRTEYYLSPSSPPNSRSRRMAAGWRSARASTRT
jgi:hypothetical protein